MVRLVKIALLLFWAVELKAQKIDAFATARVNTNRVVVEQPIKVTIKAYSSTWFAQPLSFQNLQVDGAYVQSFKRTVGSIEYVNGKKYAALEFYYVLFPYASGEIVFPELTLTTSIPPENDYRGQPVTLKTKPITITVDPPPAEADADRWLVATNASIRNQWSVDLNTLKVGEVINRRITINASGTLPTFIDEPRIEDIPFGSIYTSEPQFVDTRDDKSVNGRRIDNYSYLLEEVGEFIIPEIEITWWNPYVGQFYKRKLPEYKLIVGENPEMSSLQQLKDSLNALNPSIAIEEEEMEAGVDWLKLAKRIWVVLFFVFKLGIVLAIIRYLIKWIAKKRITYAGSEAYWFNKMMRQKDAKELLNHIYKWMEKSKFRSNYTIASAVENDTLLQENLQTLKKKAFVDLNGNEVDVKSIKKGLAMYRKSIRKEKQGIRNLLKGINP